MSIKKVLGNMHYRLQTQVGLVFTIEPVSVEPVPASLSVLDPIGDLDA